MMAKQPRMRLDQLLVKRGLFSGREQARRAIMAGEVTVDGQLRDKPGTPVSADAAVDVKSDPVPFVSRGGLKLQHALDTFGLPVKDKLCMDVGASTGGFTDCLLQRGAHHVIAVDVGYGQLAWSLRQDDRVTVRERTNFRHTQPGDFPPVDLIVIDVSFISLKLILPAAKEHLKPDGHVIALVKPQFEAGRERVGKGGIVSDPAVHVDVIGDLGTWAEDRHWRVLNVTASPITGATGNVEFLIHLSREADEPADLSWRLLIPSVVGDAHDAHHGSRP